MWELTEAVTPDDNVLIVSLKGDEIESFIVIGGRVFPPGWSPSRTVSKINLKNIKVPHIQTQASINGKPTLLFHGSKDKFDKFNSKVWLTSDIQIPLFHAEYFDMAFGQQGRGGNYIYAVILKSDNLFVMGESTINDEIYDIDAGQADMVRDEKGHRTDKTAVVFENGYDAIVWKNSTDAGIGFPTDIYLAKYPQNVQILKRMETVYKTVDIVEYFNLLKKYGIQPSESILTAYNKKLANPDKIIKTDYQVLTPGLTPYDAGDYISKDEYDQHRQYGLTIR